MPDVTVNIQGRVATDPELKSSKNNGNPFATFRIASTARRQVAPGSYEDGETSWFTVYAFGYLGANVLQSIKKGDPVVVTGKLTAREFKREDGSLGHSVSVNANGVGHDLTWGQTAYEKVTKPSYGKGDRFDDAIRTVEEEQESGFGDPERDDYLLAERPTDTETGPLVQESAA